MTRARRCVGLLVLLAAVAATRVGARAESAGSPAQERRFMRAVHHDETANQITSDLPYYVGRHVAFVCTVESVVRADTLVGQCGKDIEPVEFYIRMSTKGHAVGQRMRVLGVMSQPAMWTDIVGHTVYYPILRAVYVDPVK